MDIATVITQFATLAGLSSQEAVPWTFLCEFACSHILSIIRSDTDIAANASRLNMAAAGCAFYRYCLVKDASGIDFKLGEMAVSTGGKNLTATALLEQDFKAIISDLLDQNWFVFRQVGSHGC